MDTQGTIQTKASRTFLIWGAAAVLLTFTAVGGRRALVLTGFGPQTTTLSSPNQLGGVVSALQAGNAEALARYFDSYVELTLPDRHVGSCSKSQAKMVLRDFFDTYKVKGFDVQVKGGSQNPGYCLGTLQTTGGNFRTTLFIREEGEQTLIKEIALAH